MKNFLLLFCFALFFAFVASAQTNQTSSCPKIDVSGGELVEPGKPLTFTLNIENYDLSKLSFNWTVSTGDILEGQETPTIKISTKKWEDINTKATIKINGLPENCANVASLTASLIIDWSSILVDEYEKIPFEEEKNRLSKIELEFFNKTDGKIYFVVNLTRKQTITEIKNRVLKIKNYLIETLKIPKDRIVFVFTDSSYQSYQTKIYIVPASALPPEVKNKIDIDIKQ